MGIAQQTIGKYEANLITDIPISRLEQLAQILGCSPQYLAGWDNRDMTKTGEAKTLSQAKLLPLYNLHSTLFSFANNSVIDEATFVVDNSFDADFCYQMNPDDYTSSLIKPNMIALVRRQSLFSDGDICATFVDNKLQVQKLKVDINRITAITSKKTVEYDKAGMNKLFIVGKVIGFVWRLKDDDNY
jgi:Helix-turn-helix.